MDDYETTAYTPCPPPEPVRPPGHDRWLDLVGLVALIILATVVFTVAGPTGLTSVTGVGAGLFATWRSARRP
ncbi:hypothetical protein [Kitasatospora sp. McL0602]|uniref:hypothetical protein n=1 Tax=Kitasatospora sp. McL0602 TaxID=3439530 RepID=UPI003F89574D